jgi:hypothetical protein
VVLAGQSDLAEIAALCAFEHEIEIIGIVQKGAEKHEFVGLPVFTDFDSISKSVDAILITDVIRPRETCEAAVARFGVERVLVPELLRIPTMKRSGSAK